MKTTSLGSRVAWRYLARDFATPEGLKEYLHEHPHADKSKHHVTKHDEKGHEEKGHGEEHEEHHDSGSMVSRLKGALKGLASKLKDAPAAAQKFVADAEHRKDALNKGVKAVKEAPRKYVDQLVKTVKHEGKEFKAAGKGIAAVMKGGKASPAQKKAIKAVATHMAITAAAAVLTTASPALAALAMGKALGKHIAVKAALEVLGDLHVLQEVGHIGHGAHELVHHGIHGLMHILKLGADEGEKDDDKEVTPEEALAGLVLKHVSKLMKDLDDDTLAEGLGGDTGESKEARVAARYLSRRVL